MSNPRKLVVLDLDDLLVKRHRGTVDELTDLMAMMLLTTPDKPQTELLSFPKFIVEVRPGLGDFLKQLFQRCQVAVWTSATRFNAELVVNNVFTPAQKKKLVFFWYRDQCALDPSYDPTNPPPADSTLTCYSTIKPIQRIFESPVVNEKRIWTQSGQNILIIDNSAEKLRFNDNQASLVWPDFERPLMEIFDHPFFNA